LWERVSRGKQEAQQKRRKIALGIEGVRKRGMTTEKGRLDAWVLLPIVFAQTHEVQAGS